MKNGRLIRAGLAKKAHEQRTQGRTSCPCDARDPGLQDHQPAREILFGKMNKAVEVAGTLVKKGGANDLRKIREVAGVLGLIEPERPAPFLTQKSGTDPVDTDNMPT
jgi:hypothetical protein